jgi:hypothetical protein
VVFLVKPPLQVHVPSLSHTPCSDEIAGSSLHVWSLPGVHTFSGAELSPPQPVTKSATSSPTPGKIRLRMLGSFVLYRQRAMV